MELPLVVDAVDYGTLEGANFFSAAPSLLLPPPFSLKMEEGGMQAPLDLPLDPPLLEAEKLPLRPYALLAGAEGAKVFQCQGCQVHGTAPSLCYARSLDDDLKANHAREIIGK